MPTRTNPRNNITCYYLAHKTAQEPARLLMANCLVIETATLHVHCTLLLPTPLHFGELKVEVGHSSGTIHPPGVCRRAPSARRGKTHSEVGWPIPIAWPNKTARWRCSVLVVLLRFFCGPSCEFFCGPSCMPSCEPSCGPYCKPCCESCREPVCGPSCGLSCGLSCEQQYVSSCNDGNSRQKAEEISQVPNKHERRQTFQ